MYTKELGRKLVIEASRTDRITFHVSTGDGGNWVVFKGGRPRVLRKFGTQPEAINFAGMKAARERGEVIVHEKSGQVERTISFC